jgi:hypothetical protein
MQQEFGAGEVASQLGDAWDPEFPLLFLLAPFECMETCTSDDML